MGESQYRSSSTKNIDCNFLLCLKSCLRFAVAIASLSMEVASLSLEVSLSFIAIRSLPIAFEIFCYRICLISMEVNTFSMEVASLSPEVSLSFIAVRSFPIAFESVATASALFLWKSTCFLWKSTYFLWKLSCLWAGGLKNGTLHNRAA